MRSLRQRWRTRSLIRSEAAAFGKSQTPLERREWTHRCRELATHEASAFLEKAVDWLGARRAIGCGLSA